MGKNLKDEAFKESFIPFSLLAYESKMLGNSMNRCSHAMKKYHNHLKFRPKMKKRGYWRKYRVEARTIKIEIEIVKPIEPDFIDWIVEFE